MRALVPTTPEHETEQADWPRGGGEMGARVRAFDWSATPLGPSASWPQSLRTAVDLMLDSPLAMYIAWGPELISLFNDEYMPLIAGKLPRALGLTFWQLWSELSDALRPLVEAVLAGEGQLFRDMPFELADRSAPSWFTFSWTPLRDESGQIRGFFGIAIERTHEVLAQREMRAREARQAFLVRLGDVLRPLADPAGIQAEAACLLGRQLGASRVLYGETAGDHVISHRGHGDGLSTTLPPVSLRDVGERLVSVYRSGRTVVCHDVLADPSFTPDEQAGFRAAGFRAYIAVPLVKQGEWVATLAVHSIEPRGWTPDEVTLVEETAERTWEAVERARVEQALREAHDELELRVAERTAALHAEIREHERTDSARVVLQRQLTTVQEDERRRIARDLHDQTGQLLASLSLAVRATASAGPLPPHASERLVEVQHVADELGKQVHELAVRLRPVALDDLGLEAALRELTMQWSNHCAVPVDVQTLGLERERLPLEVETTIYRVVQEALTNIAKHAHARQVSVVVARHEGHVTAVIEDDGQGFEPSATPRGRLGLLGMRERLALLGGHLDIESSPGSGATLIARAPSTVSPQRPPSYR